MESSQWVDHAKTNQLIKTIVIKNIHCLQSTEKEWVVELVHRIDTRFTIEQEWTLLLSPISMAYAPVQ